MSSKKTREKQEFLVFLLVLYVMGFAFLYSNIAVAITLLGLAFFLTMVAFPPVWKAVRTTVKWLIDIAQKRAAQTHETAETSRPEKIPTTETVISESREIQTDNQVQELINVIRDFRAIKPLYGKKLEKKLQQAFGGYLGGTKYRDLARSEVPIGRSIIDFQIERIGIELKYSPSYQDFGILFSQVEQYAKSGMLDHVIVVLYKEQDRANTIDFEKRIQPYYWGRKISVVSIP
jgi:hypothetical protein